MSNVSWVGLIPGMMRCVIVGIEVSVASCMCFVQLSKCVSISSKVGSVCVGTVCWDSVCLYWVQLALWKDLRGRMGICMGYQKLWLLFECGMTV